MMVRTQAIILALALCLSAFAPVAVRAIAPADAVVGGRPAPPGEGDDSRAARAYRALAALQPDRSIASIAPALVDAARKPVSDERNTRRISRYLVLVGRAFDFDDNDVAAAQAYGMAAHLDPDNLLAQEFQANALAKIGRAADTAPIYARLEHYVGDKLSPTRALAFRALRQSDIVKATQLLHKALEVDHYDPISRVVLAKTLALQGWTKEASEQFAHAAKHEQSPYMKEMMLGYSASVLGKHEAAAKHYRAAGTVLPDDPLWHTKLGLTLSEEDKAAGALEQFYAGAACPRLSSRSFSVLALFLSFQGKHREALRCVDYLARLKPQSAEVHMVRGQIYSKMRKPDQAIPEFHRAVALNPFYSRAYLDLASAYKERKDLEAAINTYRRCVKNCPNFPHAWRHLGDALRSKGKLKEAAAAYESGIATFRQPLEAVGPSLQNQLARMHAGLGTCYYKTSRKQAALDQARQFNLLKPLVKRPDHFDWVLLRPERLDFKKSTPPTDAEKAVDHAALADMLWEANEYALCCEEYRRAIALDPNNVDWHMCYLSALIDKGDWLEGLKQDVVVANKLMERAPQVLQQWQKNMGKKTPGGVPAPTQTPVLTSPTR